MFRVVGGRTHTFNFHGAESDDFQINTELKPAASEAALRYLDKHQEGTKKEGKAGAIVEATWRLNAEMEKNWLGASDDKARRHSRLTLFNQTGADVFVGNAWSDHYRYSFPFLHVQKSGEAGLQSAFVSLVETYAGEPFIASQKTLAVTPNETDARAAAAVEVLLKNGRRDIVFADGHPDTIRTIEGGLTVAGEFAFYSQDAQGLRQMHLAGGTRLKQGDIGITVPQPQYSGRVTAAHYADRTFEVGTSLPAGALQGEVVLLGNTPHAAEFNLQSTSSLKNGARVLTVETPQFYQSKITQVDPATNSLVCELAPTAVLSDPNFYEGATASNEAGDKFWKVHVVADERWMHLGWPGYRTSWPDTIKLSEIPDSNGDGKRTLRMLATLQEGDVGGNELILEVTRVDENEGTFYFKMPKDERYRQGGWQFNFRTLVNEDGSKTWRSLYAGSSYRFVLQGPAIHETDFRDSDKDGKRKVKIFHFGPGDTFTVPARVAVTRVGQDEYEVRANTPCTLTLPGQGRVEWKDATIWRAVKATALKNSMAVEVTSSMLTGGPGRLRIVR